MKRSVVRKRRSSECWRSWKRSGYATCRMRTRNWSACWRTRC